MSPTFEWRVVFCNRRCLVAIPRGEIVASLIGHYGGTWSYGNREFFSLEKAQEHVERELGVEVKP